MPVSDGTIEFLIEILSPMGRITARRMFGGAGIYCDGVIFGLHIEHVLCLKADAASIPAFEAEGCGPFSYDTKHGARAVMSYWRAPERLYDEADEFVEWARRALAVSLSAPVKKKAKRKPALGPASSKPVAAPKVKARVKSRGTSST